MENMPYREELDDGHDARSASHCDRRQVTTAAIGASGLPVLTGGWVTLRELRTADAASLFALLTTEEVSRFISPPPSRVEGFERFIAWTQRQRAAGTYACFAVTLEGLRHGDRDLPGSGLEAGFETAEWGFAIGSAFWGTGVFQEGAELVLEFAFDTLGVHRLEARAAVQNGRGNGALQKLGAVQEGVLRQVIRARTASISTRSSYAIVDRRLARGARRGCPELSRARALTIGQRLPRGPATIDGRPFFFVAPRAPSSTGRDGSLDHSLHEPAIQLRSGKPRVLEREQIVTGRHA